jgi:hypothetical protein
MFANPMRTLSIEEVDAVWNQFSQASEKECRRLAHRMKETQPVLMVYLLAADENLFEEKDRGRLMELGSLVWTTMDHYQPSLRPVTEEEIDQAEAANIQHLKTLDEGSEMSSQEGMQKLISSYNQMPLLGAALEALVEDDPEEPDLLGEDVGLALLHLKSVIDCLDQ